MKKIFIYTPILMILIASVIANGWPSECTDNGFDFGIAKYECGSAAPSEGPYSGYSTSVTWTDCTSVDWTSVPAADGIISKEGSTRYITYPGTESGTVTQSSQNAISHITLCGNNNGNEIPEFTTIGAALALLGAGAYMLKKRKK